MISGHYRYAQLHRSFRVGLTSNICPALSLGGTLTVAVPRSGCGGAGTGPIGGASADTNTPLSQRLFDLLLFP